MAEETVDRAIVEYGLKGARPCATEKIQLVGSHGWNKMMFIKLVSPLLPFSLPLSLPPSLPPSLPRSLAPSLPPNSR